MRLAWLVALVPGAAACSGGGETRTLHYGDGEVWSEIHLLHGRPQGSWTTWYENGVKRSEGSHRDGERDGPWTIRWENGALQAGGSYARGRQVGEWTYRFASGTRAAAGSFRDGLREGQWTEYYGDGSVRSRVTYHGGRADLVARTYWPNGKVQHEWTYDNGTLDGPYRDFGEDGADRVVGTHRAGLRQGLWLTLRPDGSVDEDRSGYYEDGGAHGRLEEPLSSAAGVKILFLSQRVPYPPNRGDKITTWHIVERLKRSHAVHIVAFAHDEADRSAAASLRGMGFEVATFAPKPRWRTLPLLLGSTPLTLGVYGSHALQTEVDRALATADLAYAYSSSMGAFLLRHDKASVMHFAELDSDKWRQYAERSWPPLSWIYAREFRTLAAFEHELAHSADENVLCTPLEQRIFQERIPGAPSMVVRNGVDLAHHRPGSAAPEPGFLVFVGVMNYHPNVEGMLWFCDEILPELRRRDPRVHLAIVGSHPTREVRRLARRPGVEVTGFVDDPRTWLARAAISVAPLRIARGIQNKVLEAMAMGLPVVGTRAATQGVEGVAGRDYLVADTAEQHIETLQALLREPERARELGRAARAFVEAHYDWEVCLRPLDELLARLA